MTSWMPALMMIIGIAIVWLSVAYAVLGSALKAVGWL
jgi:hypothetical protein